ncbi:MAG TPA: FHA domain-containing protein [Pyrinomonadaceae bacterium]|jgi:Zn finger protein HypA/HybF involved in hydrogenase expression|nr:FHA domain-containing protein [Pyrinomonadaceae bacterium]
METPSTFYITRDDLDRDRGRYITDGLLIGRGMNCELKLSHQSVSRLQAVIRKVDGKFRILNLQASNPFLINGSLIDAKEEVPLSTGDVLLLGLYVLVIGHSDDALTIGVERLLGYEADDIKQINPEAPTQKLPNLEELLARAGMIPGPLIAPAPPTLAEQPPTTEPPTGQAQPAKKKPPAPKAKAPALESTHMLDIWLLRIQEKAKAFRPSLLYPRSVLNARGLERHRWKRTTDLLHKWHFSILLCGIAALLLIGFLSLLATRWYASAFSPAPLSDAHARPTMNETLMIAKVPNANSCMTCHTTQATKASMEANCASCHDTSGQPQGMFVATVIPEHQAAGIGCTSCHAEHRGTAFKPAPAALQTCTQCHNNDNKRLYNGHAVSTPHGGTFGYPVTDNKWTWKGLDETAWSLKGINFKRAPTDTDDQWRSKQFHALHLYRIKAAPAMPANKEGEMSCSSCHQTFNPIDRDTPRTTCAACHNGKTDTRTGQTLIAADAPNCTSCHVQHTQDRRHWNPSLMTVRAQ